MTQIEAIAKIDDYTGLSVTPETKIEALGLDSLELLDLAITLGEGSAAIPNYNGETETVGDLIRQAVN